MKKVEVYSKLYKEGVVAVVRGDSADNAIKTAKACFKGGIKLIEITFTAPNADEVIKTLSKEKSGMIVGAGSVLDSETARIAILAGAEFIVSPSFNKDTVKLCNRYGVPVMCGILTPTELVSAMECGVDIVKLFPGDIATPNGLKALKGPFPQANFMATGGVNLDNLEEWFKAGAYAIGAGSFVTKGAKIGDYESVEKISRQLVEKTLFIIGGRK